MKTSSLLLTLALVGVLGSGCSTTSAPVDDVAAPGTLLTEPPARTTPEGNDVQGRDLPGTNVDPAILRKPAPVAAPATAPSVAASAIKPAAPRAAAPASAPWGELARRLAADGVSGPQVDALLATLPATPTQSPMGRKINALYQRRFFPKPPSTAPAARYYKGVLTEANAQACRDFLAANAAAFDVAERRYQVPRNIAVALLFVETRLGKVLADVKENAFYTLASMSVTRTPESISGWLPKMKDHEKHRDWFAQTMPKRADWAYKETKALVIYMAREGIRPDQLPSSVYGAVGLCQFMPSNIDVYGADGNNDGHVNLFEIPDAVASLANYLYRHGWRSGIDRARQHKLLMAYNHSSVYANTILALSDMVEGRTVA